jgi:hypothetical protein
MAIVAEDLKPFTASSKLSRNISDDKTEIKSDSNEKESRTHHEIAETSTSSMISTTGILLPKIFPGQSEFVWPVSSSTGAGINPLWKFLRRCADQDATPFINPKSKLPIAK